jgi:hypothetical protein
MATVNEAVQHAAEENAQIQEKQRRAKAKPDTDLLHHVNYTRTPKQRVTVLTTDGTSFENVPLEWVFTDGITIFPDKHRIYLPLTAIRSILMHNLADDKAGS